MSERAQQRTFLHREARKALDRSRGSVDTDLVTEASIQAALTPDIAKSSLFSDPNSLSTLARIASSELGLGSADITQVMQEVQRQIASESDAAVRAHYAEEKHMATHTTNADGDQVEKAFYEKNWGTLAAQSWKESVAVFGLGRASDVRSHKADVVRDQAYMGEMIVDAMRRQAARKNLEVYSKLGQTGVSNSIETIKSRLRMGEVTAEEVEQSPEYTQTIEHIVAQFEISDDFELEPGNVIDATETAVKEGIKNHLGSLLKTELLNLIQASELEVLTSDQYRDEDGTAKSRAKKIAARLGTSATLWTVALKTGGRLAIGGAVGASVLSGGSGLAIAAVLGGASGLLRERLNRAERIKQRQIDVAFGSSMPGLLPTSSFLAGRMFSEQGHLVDSFRRGTPDDVRCNIEQLHRVISDVQARLAVSMQPGKVKQDLIVFGGRNRFKAQQELLDNLANARESIRQAVEAHSDRDQIREQMKVSSRAQLKQVQGEAHDLQLRIQHAESGIVRDIKATVVGAGFAGFASAAMDVMHYAFGPEQATSLAPTLREGQPGVFTFNYQGEEHHGIVSSDGNVHLTELNKDFQLPEGIDPKAIHITSMDDSVGIYDITSGEPVAQVEITEYTTTKEHVLKETTEVANLSSGPRDTYAFTGQDGTDYRVILDKTGKATLVRDTSGGWMNASDDIPLLADDVVARGDILTQANHFNITTASDGVLEIRSIYNPDKVIASINAQDMNDGAPDIVSQPATLQEITYKAGDIHTAFAMDELSGWESEVLEHRYDELSGDYWPAAAVASVGSAALVEPNFLPSDQSRPVRPPSNETTDSSGQPISAIGETVPHERLIEREANRIASKEKRRTMKRELITKQTEFKTKFDAINQAITTAVTELTAKRGDAVAVADIEALATQREKFIELETLGQGLESFLFAVETVGSAYISYEEIDASEHGGSVRKFYVDNMEDSVIIGREAPFDAMIIERIMVTLNSARGAMEVALNDDAMSTASKLAKLKGPLAAIKAIDAKFNEKIPTPLCDITAITDMETALQSLEHDVEMAEQFLTFKANFGNPTEVWAVIPAALIKFGILRKATAASPFKLKIGSDTVEVANSTQFNTLLTQFKAKGEGKVGLKAVGILNKLLAFDPKAALPRIVQIIQRLQAGEADIFAVPTPPPAPPTT